MSFLLILRCIHTNLLVKVKNIALLFMILSMQTLAQSIILSDTAGDHMLTKEELLFYVDSLGQTEPNELTRKVFAPSPARLEKLHFENARLWIRLTVRNNSSCENWFLEILEFGIPELVFHDIQHNNTIRTGYAELFRTREYPHKNFAFSLHIPPGQSRSYLLSVPYTAASGPVMKIRSDKVFIAYSNKEYLLLGFYYGLLILILSYNLLLYLSLRDKSHLFYVCYVASIGIRSLQGDGLGFQYLWSSSPWVNEWLYLAPQILLISFSAYSIHFLELRRKHTHYYRAVVVSLAAYFIAYLLHAIYSKISIELIYLFPYLTIYVVSVLVYRKGFLPTRFFILGYSLLIFSQIAYFMISKGLHLKNEVLILLFVYSLNIGFVVEVYIFSVALADKIKWFKKEKEEAQQAIIEQLKINEELKDKVNKELELKVSERTKALEKAKEQLQEQAEQINAMNQQLDLENYKLKANVKEITMERGLLKALSFEDFVSAFPNESACYRFIEEVKWGEYFGCFKCGHTKYSTGKDRFSRQCTRCRYIETIKANTIFHNLKFPIEKAFQLIYLTLISEEEISTYALADKLKLQQKTCWAFRQKVLDKIQQKRISKKDLMEKGWSILIRTD